MRAVARSLGLSGATAACADGYGQLGGRRVKDASVSIFLESARKHTWCIRLTTLRAQLLIRTPPPYWAPPPYLPATAV